MPKARRPASGTAKKPRKRGQARGKAGVGGKAPLETALKSFKSEVRDRIASGRAVTRSESGGRAEAFAARDVQVRIAELEAKAAAIKPGKRSRATAKQLTDDLDRLKARSKH